MLISEDSTKQSWVKGSYAKDTIAVIDLDHEMRNGYPGHTVSLGLSLRLGDTAVLDMLHP